MWRVGQLQVRAYLRKGEDEMVVETRCMCYFGCMDDALRRLTMDVPSPEIPSPKPRVCADWPLMTDILSHRAGMPEHLIRWSLAVDRKDEPDL